MDLKHFNFPEVDMLSMVFSTLDTIPELLEEAEDRGFASHKPTPYNKLFNDLFFSGGHVQFKKDVDEEFKQKAWPYCCALMRSFAPKHEHKEAVCAMLMSELLEPELAKE